ncbi:glycosyltransferase family 4 protein [Natronorubrum daqingense]|uniref:Glycosyl transferase family 1 n=1 Tax=Natronorubrum daqingense TaxID=588898 RepID=A0A1N7C347_9EURY|nr:glycosyltransferase family 4 protein [Natronorubrum daqingense]APX96717.1 glycosyl transferase family 1 [Natronorubrum daqingense]SIR57987.1 Glycosyltransferase involved in cell wall bisynthesis [Natronorubrum daqingense]
MSNDDVLVVTHPLAPASENHVDALLEILSAITSVALVTTNLSAESEMRESHEVLEISDRAVGDSIPVAALRFVLNQLRMCRTIAKRDESIVLFFGATSYLLPIAFAKLLGRTVVLEPRGDVPLTLRLQWEQRVPNPIARFLAGLVWGLERVGYRVSDAIITYTPSMAAQLDLEGYDHKLYPNGARYVDTDRFSPKTPFEERDRVVGFLGRLDEEKNVRTLASAAAALPDDITFRFIGDGPLREALEHELSEEIATGDVEFTGWVDHEDVPRELSSLQLLVLPSQPTEGLPTVILESLACGTPVLATPVSGVPDVVRKGETGFLLHNTTRQEINTSIQQILSRECLLTISKQGREVAETTYSIDGAVNRYERILRSISVPETS